MKESRIHIQNSVSALEKERVPLIRAKGRVSAEDVLSPVDLPACDESLRDGFVISEENPLGQRKEYFVTGEIAAGSQELYRMQTGSAYRIYTGAMIPEGGTRVVPFEQCRESESRVGIAANSSARSYIKKRASVIQRKTRVVVKGIELESDHISLMTSLSIAEIEVSRRPRIACYCTGNELANPGERPGRGRKNSINGWVLADRLPGFGGLVESSELLPDDISVLSAMFSRVAASPVDLLVTTGGMGPGKYDLVRSTFVDAGGEIILDTLPMRPGKSILLGRLGRILCVALPGPPQAVRTLVNELVGPLLLLMQGAVNVWPEQLQAVAAEDLKVKPGRVVRYRGGVLSFADGRCLVKTSGPLEPVSCYIAIAPGSEGVKYGDLVTVHLCR